MNSSSRPALLASLLLLLSPALRAETEKSVWDSKKSGWTLATPAQREETFAFAKEYAGYLGKAKTTLASTAELLKLAKAAGFSEYKDPGQVKPGARLAFTAHDRALILAVIGSEPVDAGLRVVGAHQDSPHIALKGRPVYAAGKDDYALLKTIYYGGIKKYQWGNVPLALMGRVDTVDGRHVEVSIGNEPGDPVFVIPDNAPHSDKDLRSRGYGEVFKGEELDPVAGTVPQSSATIVAAVMRLLRERLKIQEEDLVSAELSLVPAAAPMDVGLDRGLLGGYGQDDRVSAYCAARALTALEGTPKFTALAYFANFEEVGSVNNTGAASDLLNSVISQLAAAQKGARYSDLDLRRALRGAQVLSADASDGINPIFSDTSEASNAARLGFGPDLKLYGEGFNANSEFIAHIRGLLDRNAIPWQTQTPKVEVGGGGTIGGFMSRYGMEVIDIGVPLLSMHSPFEMSSKIDVYNYYRFMLAFYRSP